MNKKLTTLISIIAACGILDAGQIITINGSGVYQTESGDTIVVQNYDCDCDCDDDGLEFIETIADSVSEIIRAVTPIVVSPRHDFCGNFNPPPPPLPHRFTTTRNISQKNVSYFKPQPKPISQKNVRQQPQIKKSVKSQTKKLNNFVNSQRNKNSGTGKPNRNKR